MAAERLRHGSVLDRLIHLSLAVVGLGLVGEYVVGWITVVLPFFVSAAVALMCIKVLSIWVRRSWF